MSCVHRRSFQASQVASSPAMTMDVRDLGEQPPGVSYSDEHCETSPSRCLRNDFDRGMLSSSSSSSSTSLHSFGSARSFGPRKHSESFGRALSSIVLRQLKDDDSLAGDFDRHQFLDDASRQEWNPQHGVSGVVRYCWVDGPGWSPSTGPVSSSWCDLAAHLATIDRLHDQYLATFRRAGTHSEVGIAEDGPIGTQYENEHEVKDNEHASIKESAAPVIDDRDLTYRDNGSLDQTVHSCCCDLHYIRRVRLAYNWFVSSSSPREKRAQERREKLRSGAEAGSNGDKTHGCVDPPKAPSKEAKCTKSDP